MNSKSNMGIIRKIYREKDINKISSDINMLGKTNLDTMTFLNLRLLTTMIVFVVILYNSDLGYILAPFLTILYYYLFYYLLIADKINKRAKKLDKEALEFFEILTLTLESGKNLKNAIAITVENVESELSYEFKRALDETEYSKSLMEALHDMKNRIPSETVNNIILNITQTSIFGSSILDTMYNQIDFLRDKQVFEIKGVINKIPNKISILSVVFIIPLILILIFGPFIISLFM